jgi:hypothetical protein
MRGIAGRRKFGGIDWRRRLRYTRLDSLLIHASDQALHPPPIGALGWPKIGLLTVESLGAKPAGDGFACRPGPLSAVIEQIARILHCQAPEKTMQERKVQHVDP